MARNCWIFEEMPEKIVDWKKKVANYTQKIQRQYRRENKTFFFTTMNIIKEMKESVAFIKQEQEALRKEQSEH